MVAEVSLFSFFSFSLSALWYHSCKIPLSMQCHHLILLCYWTWTIFSHWPNDCAFLTKASILVSVHSTQVGHTLIQPFGSVLNLRARLILVPQQAANLMDIDVNALQSWKLRRKLSFAQLQRWLISKSQKLLEQHSGRQGASHEFNVNLPDCVAFILEINISDHLKFEVK